MKKAPWTSGGMGPDGRWGRGGGGAVGIRVGGWEGDAGMKGRGVVGVVWVV